ncbi:tetratricopeptide repeat protein [Gimesia sp.]|uniref:tetratricopeptide repeat protein n=1 Tax=Gimesia sp. TaxID=2024833 RepID=UPI003A9589C1
MPEPEYLEYLNSLDLTDLLALEHDNPDEVDLLIRIGMAYFKSYQLDKCNEYYERALKIDPYDGWSHLFFGNLCYGLKCYDEAITHFGYAAEFLPDVSCPHWCLGDAYRAHGDFTRADWHYHKSVEIDPGDPKARQKLEDWLDENDNAE